MMIYLKLQFYIEKHYSEFHSQFVNSASQIGKPILPFDSLSLSKMLFLY